MLLALDIGNTQITLGVFNKDKLEFVSRLYTDKFRTADQYSVDVKGILNINNISCSEIDGAIICSVVPHLTTTLSKVILTLTSVKSITIESDINTGIKTKNIPIGGLGGDLAVGAVAAEKIYGGPCIVVDIGTATTIMVIDKDVRVLGGIISAGPAISLDALTRNCDLITAIDLKTPKNIFSGDSNEAMCSGILIGTAAMIDGICERIEEELGYKCELIITGGPSSLIAPLCRRKYLLRENLLLDGLKILYDNK